MSKIEIIVLKSDVEAEVGKVTGYTGDKTEAENQSAFHDRVATTESDADLLSRYWRDACAHLVDSLRTFITEARFGRESLQLSLEVSGSYDEVLTPSVENGMFAYICAYIMTRWFAITFPERSKEWKAEAASQFDCLLANLYHRKKPIRG